MPHYTALDFLIFAYVAVIIPCVSLVRGMRSARGVPRQGNLRRQYVRLIAQALIVSFFIFLVWQLEYRPFAALGLDIPVGTTGQIGFVVDALLVGIYARSFLLGSLSPERIDKARRTLDSLKIVPHTSEEARLFVLVAIAGGTFEELAYRGYLLWFASPLLGIWGAAFASSAIFGLAHAYQTAREVVHKTAIGLMFAAGLILTHSLWWLIIAHIVINVSGALFARRLDRAQIHPA